MSSDDKVPPPRQGLPPEKKASLSSPFMIGLGAATEAQRQSSLSSTLKRRRGPLSSEGNDDDEEEDGNDCDDDAFVTDPLALATMSRSERKRHREKKRRSDVNRGFDDLLQLLVQIDPLVRAEVEDERARRAQLRGENALAAGAAGGGSSKQASASQEDSNFLSRVDLIERTTRTLKRLNQENEQRKAIIAQLTQFQDPRMSLSNSSMERLQQPQPLPQHNDLPNHSLRRNSDDALIALLAGEDSSRRDMESSRHDMLLRQMELSQLTAAAAAAAAATASASDRVLLRERESSQSIALAAVQARNEGAQREAILRNLLLGGERPSQVPSAAALPPTSQPSHESGITGVGGISELTRTNVEAILSSHGSERSRLLQTLLLLHQRSQDGLNSSPNDEPYLNSQLDPRTRGPFG